MLFGVVSNFNRQSNFGGSRERAESLLSCSSLPVTCLSFRSYRYGGRSGTRSHFLVGPGRTSASACSSKHLDPGSAGSSRHCPARTGGSVLVLRPDSTRHRGDPTK